MQRYDTYKDSGVKWLGEIPRHWEVKRLASYFTERRVKVSDKEYEPLSVTKLGVFPQWENVAKTNDGDNRKLVKKGDFVINSRSDRKGSSGVADRDGSVSLINIVLKPRNTIRADFSNYLLKSYKFIEEYYRNGRGIVADLWTTRYDEMKMIKLAVPPLEEQTAIANYLDTATAKIDAAIAQQQKMIDLLNERKQIIINRAVTKGLNPNAKMKDSGVEWIGEVPEGWEVIKTSYVFNHIGSGTTPKSSSEEFYDDNGFSFLQTGDLNDGYIKTTSRKITEKALRNTGLKIYPQGSLVIAMYGATIGKLGILNIETTVNQACCVLPETGMMDTRFAFYVFSVAKNDLIQQSKGGGQPNISQETIRNEKIVVPPFDEQKRITDYIDNIRIPIDTAIETANNQISLLQERKQIIINEVVTGKIKVV